LAVWELQLQSAARSHETPNARHSVVVGLPEFFVVSVLSLYMPNASQVEPFLVPAGVGLSI